MSSNGGVIMGWQIRRVVTGHDAEGRAKIQIDEIARNVIDRRPGYQSCVIWSTEAFPADNEDPTDAAERPVPTSLPNGTVFRIGRFEPGVAPRVHRTESLDYAVVMSGEIDMELEQGEEVRLKAGDVLVQRGTIHNWIVRGTEPCVIAFVLTSAKRLNAASGSLAGFG
jgi:quercetin dioxygenase-like cupin family protein